MLNQLPQFNQIELDAFESQLDRLLQENLAKVDELAAQKQATWETLMLPLEDLDDRLEKFWSPLSHLHAVVNSPRLRQVYQACLPKLSAYNTAMGQNEALFHAIEAIDTSNLDAAQQKIITDALLGFTLSGVALSSDKKQRFEAIQTQLSALSNQFENHILDATQAYTLHIGEAQAQGLPQHALDAAQALAQEKNLSGYILNLEIPCYLAVMTYAEDRQLRETIYQAYVTRASDQGPHANAFDNSKVMADILQLRQEKARLLGFNHYADLSLVTKMAASSQEVIDFLSDLAQLGYPQARQEFADLKTFAQQTYDLTDIQPWDIAWLSEKMRQSRYQLSQEDLRPYFPQDKVMQGMFAIVKRLYGMQFVKEEGANTWHPDVICYRVMDETNQLRGYLYADLYARQNKRGGAWMDSMQSRRLLPNGDIQLPIATLTCNFAKPIGHKPATFSHEEVTTLFHELGHCLHHLLTKVDYLSASGINGVEWDAVELPSQFFENWCWQPEALQLLSSHVDTNEPLPEALYQKLLAAKNFQSAMAMMRQLEFALFDFRLHMDYRDQPELIAQLLKDVRKQTTVVPIADYNRFQHSFSHIFAGGYAAGYYSYKWAEVLSSDAFSRFEEEGIFNEQTGRAFLHDILEVGGSKKAREAFIAFRHRAPTLDALLRHDGISVASVN